MKVITENGGIKARSVNDRAIEHSISQKTELSKKNERELTGKAERTVHQADRNTPKAETRNGTVPNRPIPAHQKKNGVAFEQPQYGETSSTADSKSVFEQRHIGAQRENGQPSGSKTAATADGKTLSPKTPSAEVGKKIQNKSQTGIKTAETAAEKTTPTPFRPPKQFNLSPSQPKNKGYKVLKNGTVDNGGITKKKERVIYSRQQTQQLQNAKPKKIDKPVNSPAERLSSTKQVLSKYGADIEERSEPKAEEVTPETHDNSKEAEKHTLAVGDVIELDDGKFTVTKITDGDNGKQYELDRKSVV